MEPHPPSPPPPPGREPGRPPPLPTRPAAPRSTERPPKKKRRWLKIVLLAVGIPVGVIGLLFSFGYLFEATAKSLPVLDRDHDVLVTAAYASQWLEDFVPDPSSEAIEKKRYLDGSHELDYEYDHPADDYPLYIGCTVSVETSTSDAKTTYVAVKAGSSIGVGLSDVELLERDDLMRYGSSSHCALVRHDNGNLVGNYFVCRTGRRVFELYLVGLYFDEAEALKEFLRPILERVTDYQP